jgi:hypothetical protein
MRAMRLLRVTPALFCVVCLAVHGASRPARPNGADYAERVTAARALAAEGSHSLAKKAFNEARTLAPDDAQRQWCGLWEMTEELAEFTTTAHRVASPSFAA